MALQVSEGLYMRSLYSFGAKIKKPLAKAIAHILLGLKSIQLAITVAIVLFDSFMNKFSAFWCPDDHYLDDKFYKFIRPYRYRGKPVTEQELKFAKK